MSFNKILLPLDGSELAEKALAPAVALAEAFSAEIILLRVVVPLALKLDPDLYQRVIDGGQMEANIYLNSIQHRSIFSTVSVESVTVVCKAAESIIDYAQENEIDLVAMSSHGRSGMSRWVFGSVAEKVLHKATCSLFIVHLQVDTEPFAHKRILVPLDGSLRAERALKPARKLAESLAAELVLLRVTGMPQMPLDVIDGWPGVESAMKIAEQEAKLYLNCTQESVQNGRVQISTLVAESPVAESIVDTAAQLPADLIVMASHDRSSVDRWLFGSVTEKTLRGGHCNTLIIQ